MGLREVPLFVEVGHDISDRRRTQILTQSARNCFRCNGFPGLDVRLHDGMQDRKMPDLGRGLSIHDNRDNTL